LTQPHRPLRTPRSSRCRLQVYRCLSVRSHYSKAERPNFTKFLCTLPVVVARSSSDGVAICYILPVLWMTSYFHTMGPTGGRVRRYAVFRVAVPAGVADGRARVAAAHRLAGSAGRFAWAALASVSLPDFLAGLTGRRTDARGEWVQKRWNNNNRKARREWRKGKSGESTSTPT